PQSSNKKTVRLWPRMAVAASRSKFGTSLVAAAAVAAIVFGVWFFNSRYDMNAEPGTEVAKVNDIAPGKNGATITLANGKVIQLSDAKSGVVVGDDRLAYNDGSAIRHPEFISGSRTSEASMLTATTAKGQTYQFTLPDGTKVWLNAGSKLEFPSKFGNVKQRIVRLSGEGYFEVAKNKKMPFIVKTIGSSKIPEQEITVLGTHFNVNAYEDEGEVKTTLLEGSVALDYGGTDLLLKPGQQARTDIENEIIIKKVEAEEAVAWIDNKYIFEEETIESIMRTLSRWYDVEVVYEGNVKHKKFSGILVRKEYIAKILDQIAFTEAAHFKIEGRRITVMP
ncbi:MAG TPA: FecR domain-containing protein, partial [Pedobacter sp.]|uniref:FecR family protein n=1 Tax=Pedobacter sp. TaxID=1411316 RepID=UPI002CA1A1BD